VLRNRRGAFRTRAEIDVAGRRHSVFGRRRDVSNREPALGHRPVNLSSGIRVIDGAYHIHERERLIQVD